MRWIWLILLCMHVPCQASATMDSAQQIHVIADSAVFNFHTGKNIYEGHVKITKEDSEIIAERFVTQSDKQHKLTEVIAYGTTNLAEYRTLPTHNEQALYAKAHEIKFYPLKSIVYLTGNAIVTQGNNHFQGEVIIYNMREKTVVVPASKNSRATIIINPQ